MRRAAGLLVVGAAAIAGCGGGADPQSPQARALAAERAAGAPLYWVGPSFGGLPLTDVMRDPRRTTLIYGSCTPSGDTGCATPLQIQVSSICDSNALVLDIRPRAAFRAGAMQAFDYGDGQLALDAGTSRIRVFADGRIGGLATSALRAVTGGTRPAAPRYPRYYLDQLRRVLAAHDRLGDVKAVRDELGISKSAVRFELRLARALGRQRLEDGRGASPALAEVKQTLLQQAERGSASRGDCELEPVPG